MCIRDSPNPEIALVSEGAALAEHEQVDIVLPVGGGSAMDCAKGIAIATGYTGCLLYTSRCV